MILVRIEVWVSIIDFNIPAGIFPTGMAFVPSHLKTSFWTSSSVTSWKESQTSLGKLFWWRWNLSNIAFRLVGVPERVSLSPFKSESAVILSKCLFIQVAKAFSSEIKTSSSWFQTWITAKWLDYSPEYFVICQTYHIQFLKVIFFSIAKKIYTEGFFLRLS